MISQRTMYSAVGIETRSRDGNVKWGLLLAQLRMDDFKFARYARLDRFKDIERDLAPHQAIVGGTAKPTWIHPHVAKDVADYADAPQATRDAILKLPVLHRRRNLKVDPPETTTADVQGPSEAGEEASTSEPPAGELAVEVDATQSCQIVERSSEDTQSRIPTTLTYQQVMNAIGRVPEGEEFAGYGSVIDAIQLVTNKNRNDACETLRILRSKEKILISKIVKARVPTCHKKTDVAPSRVLVEIVMLCPGNYAREFRVHCCELLCRVFAGDPNLHVDIDKNRDSMSEQDRRRLVQDVPGAAGAGAMPPSEKVTAVNAFCGKSCAASLDLTTLLPVPGLSSELPSLEAMKRHGNYFFVLGMSELNGSTLLVVKPGASFHGVDGMYGRYLSAARDFPNMAVMFMESSTATVARDGENAMTHSLSALGNAFQIGGTEKWIVTVAPGMHVADAARTVASRLHESLPAPQLDPPSGNVPDEVTRAFRAATESMRADGSSVKGKLWSDDSGHCYSVETVRAENELKRHKVDKEVEVEKLRIETESSNRQCNTMMSTLERLLCSNVISKEDFFSQLQSLASLTVKPHSP